MLRQSRIFLALAGLAFVTAGHAALPLAVDGQPVVSLAPLVEKTSPAVVNIRVSQTVAARQFGSDAFRRYFGLPDTPQGGTRQATSAGSGVIVDAANGYILTNHHVVDGADEIEIFTFDGRTLDATIIGSDERTDIAVIQVEADDLVEMPIGDSEALRVGDFVLAIGNPFGLQHTVTSGIVSALGRMGIGRGDTLEDFIQTDASINPGNSGGALVNMSGELVGINSAIISRSGGNVGIGFAVPTEIASSIMRQILDFGEVRRGLLGVTINPVDREVAEALNISVDSGAIVTSVAEGSAAERAGLEVDDIIVEINSKRISNAFELVNTIGLMSPGEEVTIRYVRGERTRTATAQLGQRIAQSVLGEDIHPGLAGAEFSSSSTSGTRGIEVASVLDGSPASQRDIRAGDIITAANRRSVNSIADLSQVVGDSNIVFLYIVRGDRTILRQIR